MQITHVRTNDSLRRSLARRAALLGWLPVAAAVALTGCTTKKADAPPISGPSELGTSLEMRVSPDVLVMDGVSRSTLTIKTRDENGKIKPNVDIRVEVMAGGQIVDVVGSLSAKNVKTGGDGTATVVYTAPNSVPSQNSDSGEMGVTLLATPAGYDYRSAFTRQIDIRLVPQGTVLPQAGSPVPKFTMSPASPGEDQDVIFDASSSIASCLPNPTDPNNAAVCVPTAGAITSYQWDFGNGQTGSGARVTTRFATQGTYNVKLVVTNDRGLSNSLTQAVTIVQIANPTAVFTTSPSAPLVNQQVFFDANGSQAAPGRSITRYDWNFGDGSFGNGVTDSHRYARAGEFTATLTVTDSSGKTGSATATVSVGSGGADVTVANFTFSPTTIRAGQVAFFDASVSTPMAGRTITRYEWNFGDNQIVEGPRVEHVFSPAGSYTVTLTVTDSGGARAVKTQAVTVAP